eukprot:gene24654-29992_t
MGDIEAQDTLITSSAVLYRCGPAVILDASVYASIAAGNGCRIEMQSADRTLWRCTDEVVDEEAMNLVRSGACMLDQSSRCVPNQNEVVSMLPPPPADNTNQCADNISLGASDLNASAIAMYQCGPLVVDADVYHSITVGGCNIELSSQGRTLWRCANGAVLDEEVMYGKLVVDHAVYTSVMAGGCILELASRSRLLRRCADGAVVDEQLATLITSGKCIQQHPAICSPAIFPPVPLTTPPEPPLNGGFPEWCPETYDSDEAASALLMYRCGRVVVSAEVYNLNASRVFVIHPGGTLTLSALALLRGHAGDGEKDYGGIIKNQGGALLLEDSMLSGGQAWSGGAIYTCCGATTHLRACEVRSNRALATRYIDHVAGGGAFLNDDSELALVNCTILDNCPKAEQGAASQ